MAQKETGGMEPEAKPQQPEAEPAGKAKESKDRQAAADDKIKEACEEGKFDMRGAVGQLWAKA
eukprot:13939137-Heterocapsa_arctica.AAC.1